MSTVNSEHTIRVNGADIFVTDTGGDGPAVIMLHGGGPGASGVSNYSRNIDPLAKTHRVIVPDMPGYGRSTKHVDHSDPFGYLADMIRGLLDEWVLRQHIWSAIRTGARQRSDLPWIRRTASASSS